MRGTAFKGETDTFSTKASTAKINPSIIDQNAETLWRYRARRNAFRIHSKLHAIQPNPLSEGDKGKVEWERNKTSLEKDTEVPVEVSAQNHRHC